MTVCKTMTARWVPHLCSVMLAFLAACSAPTVEECVHESSWRGQEAGLACYEHILEKEPENLAALVGKGQSLLALGKLVSAQKAFERALEISPGHRPAQSGLDRIEERLEALEEED